MRIPREQRQKHMFEYLNRTNKPTFFSTYVCRRILRFVFSALYMYVCAKVC